ncbi:HAD hydrolase family protein [Salmonella enterica subsp. enterica]|nr:HAD hydrolase family protein [Salmonella enterica subsp. enterica]
MKKGCNVVLTTGRPYAGVHSYLKELRWNSPAIIASPITGAGAEGRGRSTVAQTALSYDDYRYRKNCPVRWVLLPRIVTEIYALYR